MLASRTGMWTHRHLLGIEELSEADIDTVLERASYWLAHCRSGPAKERVLVGRTIVNFFFEASTRTRTSFEVAGKRLGADVVNVTASASSVSKGETLLDTVKNIEAMHADALVIRHASSGAPHFVAARTKASIANAGDGAHEHPTQALLDAFTIKNAKGKLEGLNVAICGDITHSRVARSNAILLGKKGANVRLCGPGTMLPKEAETLGKTTTVVRRLEDAIADADVIMMLRIQNERLHTDAQKKSASPLSTTKEYARTFGLDAKKLAAAKPDSIVMHPGPINRGVELAGIVADGPRSVVLDQVEAGVAVRMAVLELLLSAPKAQA